MSNEQWRKHHIDFCRTMAIAVPISMLCCAIAGFMIGRVLP